MGDTYYRKFPGDYARDTRHLTLAEHGAYNLLLDYYYATSQPLPASIEALYRIAGAHGQDERGAVDSVAHQFFKVGKDKLRHNNKADRELVERENFIAEQSRKGQISAVKRWGAGSLKSNHGLTAVEPRFNHCVTGVVTERVTGTVTEVVTEVVTEPVTEGVTERQPKSNLPSPSPSPSVTPAPPRTPPYPPERKAASAVQFEEFWNIYPRKYARGPASVAWVECVNGDADKVLAALQWQVRSDDWTREGGRFIPTPEKYLRGQMWLNEPVKVHDPFLDGGNRDPF